MKQQELKIVRCCVVGLFAQSIS